MEPVRWNNRIADLPLPPQIRRKSQANPTVSPQQIQFCLSEEILLSGARIVCTVHSDSGSCNVQTNKNTCQLQNNFSLEEKFLVNLYLFVLRSLPSE